ncbi:MAG: 4-hydroxy-tetrahydrodipicolinate synthase [Candidatus Tokpelaia sp.]|nr:MAG: 4-hydroxy-tetrahydrodipicolinate synthase [Candidatus Tokpelaia sp.]KAA6206917.1 MAG: 4-hydroxy-tetrahydrodipicolinate synthase [Candidatus Tokpelaia sp.]
MIEGALTALITPFSAEDKVDEKAFRHLVEWQIKEGINGLVAVGTTGESPTLSHNEHKRVIELCVQQTKGRVPVIAGAGSNSTAEAIELAQYAQAAGADAALVVTPYYNKPNQAGLYAHFAAIAKAVRLPIIIYNIPGRSIIDMLPETMGRLAHDFSNIIGVKDATGKIERVGEQRRACGSGFIQLSGEDTTALAFNAQGGRGCISVTSNIAPALSAAFQQASLAGNVKTAEALHKKLLPLHQALFIEPNPAGVKYAAAKLGLCRPDLRLPLVEIAPATAEKIDAALAQAELV